MIELSNIKLIKNMEDIKKVCVYDIENKSYQIVDNSSYDISTNIGFFCDIENDIYGVMESTEGPIFFHNYSLYYLNKLQYQFVHTHIQEKIGEFQLVVDGIIKECVIYNITPYTDYDPWSLEKDVDFFQWICQSQESIELKRRFHQYYTR